MLHLHLPFKQHIRHAANQTPAGGGGGRFRYGHTRCLPVKHQQTKKNYIEIEKVAGMAGMRECLASLLTGFKFCTLGASK